MTSPEGTSDVIVIGVHTPEEDLAAIEEDLDKYKADGPVCIDTGAGWGQISQWHHVRRLPYWVVIGPDGKVASHSSQPYEVFQVARKSLAAEHKEQ